MPQARHVVPPKEVSDSHGAPDKTQDEVLELGRQLIAVASTKPAGGATAADDAEIMVAKCRALLETGADIDARDRNGVTEWTVLMHAANCGHTLLVAMLLERGVDVGLTGDDGWNVLMVAAMAGAADVAKLLVAHPGKPAVNARVAYGDGDETCALQLAAASGSADCVTVLLKAGADANAEMASGMTAPLVAASRGHWEVITALLAHRSLRRDTLNAVAPISDELYYGDEVCPLYCAVDQDAADTTQALLDKGADFSMISENQLSGLLSRVIERGDWAAIVRLLGSHAGGSGRMAEALNERVACRELEPACSGVVPMVFVPARAGQHEATALMISRGADATALDEGGVGVLSIAVELDDVAMIRTLLTLTASNPAQQASLLEARAPRSELRSASVTPLGLATLLGCEDCAKVLLEFGAPESDADEVATILRQIQEEQNAVRALGLGRSSRRGSIANYVFESVGTRTSGGAGGDPEFTGAAARAVAAADAGAGGGVDYGVGGVDATAGAARSTDADVADGGVDGVDGADHGVDDVDHGVDRVVDGFEGDGGGADESAGNGEPGGAPEQEQHQEEGGGDGETAGTEQVAAECSNE
ncbi:hypothetical protein FOA52_013794 [Chlamydomonas sp. UWO 241]|nr:hypothetical protein FOA52_013794 [Chlamydomonas sp. UWO 241]